MSKKPNTDIIDVTDAEVREDAPNELAQYQFTEMMGMRKFAESMQRLLSVSNLVELDKLKKSKKYKGMKLVDQNGKLVTVSTFAQVCESLGYTARHIDDQLANLNDLGSDVLEKASGTLGFRELRSLRRLPETERAALAEAAKAGDKEAFEDVVAQALDKQREAEAENEILRKRCENLDRNFERERLKAEGLALRQRRESVLPPPLLSRDADAFVQDGMTACAMAMAGLDILNKKVLALPTCDEHLEQCMHSLHGHLLALAGRVSLAWDSLAHLAEGFGLVLPERVQAVVSPDLAQSYVEAHTSYINTTVELSRRAIATRSDALDRLHPLPQALLNQEHAQTHAQAKAQKAQAKAAKASKV